MADTLSFNAKIGVVDFISEYNLTTRTPRNGPLKVDQVSGNVEGADLKNKSQSTTHLHP